MPLVRVDVEKKKPELPPANDHKVSDYEHLLVAHYLEELRKAPPFTKKYHSEPPASPYAQKLSHTNIVLTGPQVVALMQAQYPVKDRKKARPQSAITRSTAESGKPKMDPKFIADSDKWDPLTPRPEDEKKKFRPASAPGSSTPNCARPSSGYKSYQRTNNRPSSAKSTVSSQRSHSKRSKALEKQPHIIVATAFKNGTHEGSCKVAAPNIKRLLELSTVKLGLPMAGRRVFDSCGFEIQDGHEIERGGDIFISMGEDFKDPDASLKLHMSLMPGVTWRMNGLVLPDHGRKRNTKPVLSKRFNESIEKKMIRVVVFKNGKHTDGIEVVADPKRWPLAVDKMGQKLEVRSPVRILYDWAGTPVVTVDPKGNGREVVNVQQLPVLDSCLQPVKTAVLYGPLWASSGEGFNPAGCQAYINELLVQLRIRIKEQSAYLQQLQNPREGKSDQPGMAAILSMKADEREEAISTCEADIDDFTVLKKKLESQLAAIEPQLDEQRAMSYSYTLKHIKEIDAGARLVGVRGLNLIVYKNGTDTNSYKVFFNLSDATKRSANKQEVMNKLMEHIAQNHQLRDEGSTKGMVWRKWKLFNASGREIRDIDELLPVEQTSDEEVERAVWLSFGEAYKSPFTLCLQATFDKILGLSLIRSSRPSAPPNKSMLSRLSRQKNKKNEKKKPKPDEKKVKTFGFMRADESDEYSSDEDHEEEVASSSDEERRQATPIVMDEKLVAVREQLCLEDVTGRDKSKNWRATTGFPGNYVIRRVDISNPEQAVMMRKDSELDPNQDFLQSREDSQLLIYPELSVGSKKAKANKEMWPADSQIWVVTAEGSIHIKAFPQLVLSVTDTFVQMELPTRTVVEGFGVALKKRNYGSANQTWKFGVDGLIRSQSHPELALTYLGGVFDNPDSVKANDGDDTPAGQRYFLSVCEPLDKKDAKYQRFAIKQERLDNLGQWKHSTVENPEWNKLAYSWPVKTDGELNEKFDWPMEGAIIPLAPPTNNPRKANTSSAMRLAVIKNGDQPDAQPQLVVGPDLSIMSAYRIRMTAGPDKQKDLDKSKKASPSASKGNVNDNHHGDECADGNQMGHLHCSNLSLPALEFMLFLEQCTGSLSLPFAARRLFDASGREHFTLRQLHRDALVYVSCGEPWSDPRLTRAEQQRRYLLANLAADIAQIRQYVALRAPEDYVLEVHQSLSPNTKLVINKSAFVQEVTNDSAFTMESVVVDEDEMTRNKQMDDLLNSQTAHERAHTNAQRRMEALKWPWERLVSASIEGGLDQEGPEGDLDQAGLDSVIQTQSMISRRKIKSAQTSSPFSRYHLQTFVYVDGYLALAVRQDLVLGVAESEGRIQEVMVMKKRPDDIFQRWIIDSTGLIRAKHNPKMVLSVSLPSNTRSGDEELTLTYVNSGVNLSKVKNTQFGRANQKFFFDQETGLIHAFYTDFLDKEITAANKVNICTHAVIGETVLDQPGYEVEYPVSKNKVQKLIVCSSCARAMRGRFKTQRFNRNVDYACAMGTANERGIKLVGSFQCLNGKVDLSSFEAEHTLAAWTAQCQKLRKKRSVRAIAQEIADACRPRTLKLLVYKNGDGRTRRGELIYASSVHGVLQQATLRVYGMSFAARRLYTVDGTIVMDFEDLITWAVDEYTIKAKEAKLAGKKVRPEPEGDAANTENTKSTLDDAEGPPASDSTTASGPIEIRKLMIPRSGSTPRTDEGDTDDSQRFLDETEEANRPEQNGGPTDVSRDNDVEEPDSEEEEFINDHAKRLAELADVDIVLPSLDEILRHPIELWASCGEKFRKPNAVDSRLHRKRTERQERAGLSLVLEREKHKLRHMQGRRLDEMSPGEFLSTNDPDRPVLCEGSWRDPTAQELDQHDTVHQLQSHLMQVRATQKTNSLKTCNAASCGRLYIQPKMRRVLVYNNGGNTRGAAFVWGESLQQLLDNATLRLNLRRKAKYFFTVEGEMIEKFDDIGRDQIVCAASGRVFLQPKDVKDTLEIKANWGRARKKYGPRATDIEVMTLPNPRVDVDPFGPPLLATSSARKATTARPKSSGLKSPPADGTEFIDDLADEL